MKKIKSFFAKQARTHTKHIVVFLGVNLLVGIITTGVAIHIFLINYYQTIENTAFSRVNTAYANVGFKAERPQTELTIKEYVKQEVEKAGLKWEEVEKIIQCESSWNPDAHYVNWDNKAGVDRGLWMISSLYHKEVSNQEAYDYKTATKHAIRIYQGRGNWSAWSCAKKLGL